MTQPIQEPTTQRSIARSNWRENQLERRPSLGQSDDRPWARVGKPFPDGTFYPNQTIANNSNVTIDFDTEYNMDPGESGEGVFSTVGGPINAIRFEVQGLFAITAEVYWSEASNFPWYMNFSGDSFDWEHRTHTGYFDSFGSMDSLGSTTFIHRYEEDEQIQLVVYQRSGGNRTINACYMEAVYLGSWSGPIFDDLFPRQ